MTMTSKYGGHSTKKRTNDSWVAEVYELVGSEYTFLEPYTRARDPILVIHNKCGLEYRVKPNNFKSGKRCPTCSIRLSQEDFDKRVMETTGNEYSFLEPYFKNGHKTRVRHNICGHEYKATPNHFFKGRRCPECWFASRRMTQEEFESKVYDVFKDEYTVLGEYVTSTDSIEMRHNTCGHTYSTMPPTVMRGSGCPRCRSSKGERAIAQYLDEKNISYSEEHSFPDLKDKQVLRYDFAIYDDNNKLVLLIEFDGAQHFEKYWSESSIEGLLKRQSRDTEKDNYADWKGVPIIRIPYTEINNIEQILDSCIYYYIHPPKRIISQTHAEDLF